MAEFQPVSVLDAFVRETEKVKGVEFVYNKREESHKLWITCETVVRNSHFRGVAHTKKVAKEACAILVLWSIEQLKPMFEEHAELIKERWNVSEKEFKTGQTELVVRSFQVEAKFCPMQIVNKYINSTKTAINLSSKLPLFFECSEDGVDYCFVTARDKIFGGASNNKRVAKEACCLMAMAKLEHLVGDFSTNFAFINKKWGLTWRMINATSPDIPVLHLQSTVVKRDLAQSISRTLHEIPRKDTIKRKIEEDPAVVDAQIRKPSRPRKLSKTLAAARKC